MKESYDARPIESPTIVVIQLHLRFQLTARRCVIGNDKVSLKGGWPEDRKRHTVAGIRGKNCNSLDRRPECGR
jgi:hypothetical protein